MSIQNEESPAPGDQTGDGTKEQLHRSSTTRMRNNQHPKDIAASDPTTEVERAERLVAQGLVVIPVHSVGPDRKTCSCPKGAKCGKNAGKHPVGDDWQHHTAESGLAAVRDLATKRASRNLGAPNLGILPEPSGLVIIDCDPRNKGNETMAAHKAKGRKLTRTKANRTGSGGWHAYYKAPEGVRLKATLGEGVDIKHNGMVVAEGSVSHAGPYSVLVDEEIVELDDWVVEVGAKPPTTPTVGSTAKAKAAIDPDDPDGPRQRAYLTSAFEGELGKLKAMREAATRDFASNPRGYKGPNWNNGMFRVACKTIEIGNHPAMDRSAEDLLDVVRQEAPRDKDFDDAVVDGIINSARDRIGDKARDVPAPPIDPFGKAEPSVAGASPVRDPFKPSSNVAPIDRMKGRLWKDSHVALALSEHYADQVLNVHGLGWLKYDEPLGYFEEVPDSVILGLSDDFARELAVAAARTGDADLAKHAAARLDAPKIKNVVTLAASNHELIAEQLVNLDQHATLLNCPNGVVDLATGELLPHSPDYRMTKVTADPYIKGATHPDLDQALEALPGQEERDFLQERLGQALIGQQPKEDYLLLLHGGGANGKSALIGSLQRALGDYAIFVSDRVVTAGMEGEHTTEIVDFRGARMAFLEELPEGARLSEKRVKDLVGTPTMKGRRMRQDNISWKPTHTMFVTTNAKPGITGTTHGIWRRLVVLDFPYKYVPTEDQITAPHHRLGDLGLKPRMLGDDRTKGPYPQREAVLAWAVEGAVRYLARGDQPTPMPASVKAAGDEWRRSTDALGAFLEDNVEVAEGWCIPALALLSELNADLEDNGRKPWGDKLLATRMADHPQTAHPSLEVIKTRTRLTEEAGHSTSRYRVSHRSQGAFHSYAEGQQVAAWHNLRWKQKEDL